MSYIFEKNKLKNYIEGLFPTLKKYKAIIAGGAITSIFCNRDINDIDIYFKCKEDAGNFIGEMIEDRNWIISHTNKATAFQYNNVTYQVIHFDYFKSPQEIFDKFDFTVCMGAFDCDTEEFILHEDFLKHNAQRMLKFNENTLYPIISALRVKKYEEKHYKISKMEYLKILLTCMNHKIETYEELKEQIGGMYGINYDKIIQPKENEPFNLTTIIKKLGDIILDEDYFKTPESDGIPDDIEDLVCKITGEKIKFVKHNNKIFKYFGGDFEEIYNATPDLYEEIDINQIIKPNDKVYKFVKKVGNKYFSHYDNRFEYRIGENVVANGNTSQSAGIYVEMLTKIRNATYCNYEDSVLVELEICDINDILSLDRMRLKKAKVIREVPKTEYEPYIKL